MSGAKAKMSLCSLGLKAFEIIVVIIFESKITISLQTTTEMREVYFRETLNMSGRFTLIKTNQPSSFTVASS